MLSRGPQRCAPWEATVCLRGTLRQGRYLLGVLGRFETLPEAFGFLMHGYWREVLLSFGGLPAERDPEVLSEVKKKVSRRVGPLPVTLSKEDDVERVARIAVQLRRKTAPRYRSYESLLADWKQMVEKFLAAHPSPEETSDNHYLDERNLTSSCRSASGLYGGWEWRCGTCYNRNWVGISELEKTLRCAVCRREEQRPFRGIGSSRRTRS